MDPRPAPRTAPRRPRSPGPPIALQRVGPLRGIVSVLADLGVDPVGLLGGLGLQPAFFDDPERVLPLATVDRLFDRALEATGCAHLGLLVGMRAGVSSLGVVGYLLQSAPDLGTALRLFRAHLEVNAPHVALGLDVGRDEVTLDVGFLERRLRHGDQLLACALAIGVCTLRGLCGPAWRPSELRLAFAPPRDPAPYREHLGSRPRFGASRSAIVFPVRWLAHPLPGADPLLHRFMAARVRELRARATGRTADAVRRLLWAMVSSGDCSLEAVCARIGVPPHTLKRRLAAEGESFRDLRDEVRHTVARQLLRDARMPVGDVALALGYSEPAALTRAFRRRAGAPPGAWRRAAGDG